MLSTVETPFPDALHPELNSRDINYLQNVAKTQQSVSFLRIICSCMEIIGGDFCGNACRDCHPPPHHIDSIRVKMSTPLVVSMPQSL
jgi:hypothetical protein